MKLKAMKYKTFTWPNNPTVYNQDFTKNLVEHKYPGLNGARFEDLGSEPKTISGSGEFFGKNAYNNFKKLNNLFNEKTLGKLYHPKWGTINARLTKLSSKEEPTPQYVAYDFEFVEEKNIDIIIKIVKKKIKKNTSSSNNTGSTSGNKIYIVKKGDSLWKISKKYYGKGSQWKKIADANKKLIKNPNKLSIGWKLIIPK